MGDWGKMGHFLEYLLCCYFHQTTLYYILLTVSFTYFRKLFLFYESRTKCSNYIVFLLWSQKFWQNNIFHKLLPDKEILVVLGLFINFAIAMKLGWNLTITNFSIVCRWWEIMSRNLRFNILINKYNMVVYSLSVMVFQATQVELGQSILEINVDQPFKS